MWWLGFKAGKTEIMSMKWQSRIVLKFCLSPFLRTMLSLSHEAGPTKQNAAPFPAMMDSQVNYLKMIFKVVWYMHDEAGRPDFCSALYHGYFEGQQQVSLGFEAWAWNGPCCKTMIQNIRANPHLNGSKETKMKAFEWPTQNAALNPIEMLRQDLEQASKSSSEAQLKQFLRE